MKISGAESLVMEALWREAPQTSEQICATVAPEQDWSEPTVRTLLRRLVGKGAVSTTADSDNLAISLLGPEKGEYVALLNKDNPAKPISADDIGTPDEVALFRRPDAPFNEFIHRSFWQQAAQ